MQNEMSTLRQADQREETGRTYWLKGRESVSQDNDEGAASCASEESYCRPLEKRPVTGHIYHLLDPLTKQPRYVGQTVHAVTRGKMHRLGYGFSKRMREWFVSHRAENRLPEMVIVATLPEADLLEAERSEIRRLRALGHDLFNKIVPQPSTRLSLPGWTVEHIATGERFPSYNRAGLVYGCSGSTIRNRCNEGREFRRIG